jgi:hypothetical protein
MSTLANVANDVDEVAGHVADPQTIQTEQENRDSSNVEEDEDATKEPAVTYRCVRAYHCTN